jgi:hypothetical protein
MKESTLERFENLALLKRDSQVLHSLASASSPAKSTR